MATCGRIQKRVNRAGAQWSLAHLSGLSSAGEQQKKCLNAAVCCMHFKTKNWAEQNAKEPSQYQN